MNRMDVCAPRTRKDGKTYWHKIGAAFPAKNGGWSIVLDSLPLTDAEGRCSMNLFEPRQQGPQQGGQYQGGGQTPQAVNDDEIPF